MVVLDADSVMSGECSTTLVRLMEANPDAGIIQTAPRAAGRDTLYARIQQFANRVYGPVFIAGLHFWQLGEAHYWGHNAIIRVAPFMRHCALGRLPGRGTLSGEILSHDFVEAALMRRAGWAVWIAYDLPGSYEEMPPNLRRRAQARPPLVPGQSHQLPACSSAQGLHPAHRAVFMTGVMAYVSAPLWFLFCCCRPRCSRCTRWSRPEYFVSRTSCFRCGRSGTRTAAIGSVRRDRDSAVPAQVPRASLLIWRAGRARLRRRAAAWRRACVAEIAVLRAARADPHAVPHAVRRSPRCTVWALQWKSPPREDAETSWGEALRRHGLHTLLGLGVGGVVYWLDPSYLVVAAADRRRAGPVDSAVGAFRAASRLGRALRRAHFPHPEETDPPRVLLRFRPPLCRG